MGGSLSSEYTEGTPRSDGTYITSLRTNENNNPNAGLIKEFGQRLSETEFPETRAVVEQYMNIDEIMAYIAVDRTIRHDDGPFHWYCSNSGCYNHNYYWYEEPTRKKLHLIAWDLNDAFENIIQDNGPITSVKDKWGEYSNDCHSFQYLWARQWSAQCDKLTATWASYTEEYEQKRLEFINGPLTKASKNQLIDKWYEQIKDATIESSKLHPDALSIEEWDASIEELKEQVEHARTH